VEIFSENSFILYRDIQIHNKIKEVGKQTINLHLLYKKVKISLQQAMKAHRVVILRYLPMILQFDNGYTFHIMGHNLPEKSWKVYYFETQNN
jgi:hypothetical protein